MSGIVNVQARIGEIQGFMTALRAQAATQTSATQTSATQASATQTASGTTSGTTSFADALAASLSLAPTQETSAAAGTAGNTGTATGQGLVDAAMAYVGVPYVWGGENPATGLDCSGLVQRSMADLGVDVPRVAHDQAKLGTAVASMDAAQPGDLLIFNGGTHIAIYVGDGRMIDAPKPGKSVSVRDVYETPTAIRRVLPAAGAVAASAPISSTASLTGAVDLQRYALTMMSEGVAA
ncbi:C40 family peptidase [Pengzhenrongella phosphoraccumulans]|uniref:C40 family peptidase n=1 Tax=Pengzhenrongella phosphoraccumulans TaxID=3114394 RepID=UPI00389002BF